MKDSEIPVQQDLFDTKPSFPSTSIVHSAKRGRNERQGVHSWHRYYAGYSEHFVEEVLTRFAKQGDLVLDPWNGSGTTTFVAQRMGLKSIGIDINPIIGLHAQAKDLRLTRQQERIIDISGMIIQEASEIARSGCSYPRDLEDWVPKEQLLALLALRCAISSVIQDIPPPAFAIDILSERFRGIKYPSEIKALFLSALFQVLRKVGKFRHGSNPTWVLPSENTVRLTTDRVFALFATTVTSMMNDLQQVSRITPNLADQWTITSDSRDNPLIDASVDIIVTSPPYCTRIDYVVSTKPELLFLGYAEGEEFDKLRRSTMGSPVIVAKKGCLEESWGSTCRDFLAAVAAHSSKASTTYYLPVYLQYFSDAKRSLEEIKRVLKIDGLALLVVQSSYYKDVELHLGQIYVEMATSLGLKASVVRREAVRQHMAHTNKRSRTYVRDKVYYEDVLLLHKLGERCSNGSSLNIAPHEV